MAGACLLCLVSGAFAAQPIVRDLPPGLNIPTAAQTGPGFDVDKATQAYLDLLSPERLPLAIALFSVIFFVLTPVQNLIARSYEAEADAFGLNASREPYGWAMAAMRLSTYRKIEPGMLEEFVFYDHPSGYERVHAAMIWLGENQADMPTTVPQTNRGSK
jgi:Zn-dependent protease with chaperone function